MEGQYYIHSSNFIVPLIALFCQVNQRTKINQRQLFIDAASQKLQFSENKLTLQTLKLKLKLETFL